MLSTRNPELRNQEILKYKVWKLPFGVGNWSDTGNWTNNTVPSGGSNVLFGPYQGVCVVNTNTPSLNGFRVRNDYTSTITSNKVVTATGYFTYYGDGTLSANYSTFNISGDARFDGDGRVFWDNSIWNLNGAFNQKTLDTPVDNFSTINMLGSGKTVYSEDELNRLSIIGATSSSGDIIIKGPLNVSGTLTIPTGSNVINRTNHADVSIYASGSTVGQGVLVLEDDAQIIRQLGYIGNSDLLIRNNNVGEVLPPATYSAKNITIHNDRPSYDTFVFGNGVYNFDSNVTIASSGAGTLEVNNRFNGATVNFNRNLTIESGSFSDVIWVTGQGRVNFGKPTTIAKEFGRFADGRTAINVVSSPRGLVLSKKNLINREPLIWILDSTGLNTVTANVVTAQGHTVGGLNLGGTTGVSFGDLTNGRTPATANEQLYIGDIADESANRSRVLIYQIAEPTITGFDFSEYSSHRIYSGVYETGVGIPLGESGTRPRDCRALFNDYPTSDFYFITHKTVPAQLFRMTGHATHLGILETLFYHGTLRLGSGIVGADLSRDGTQLLVKTWDKVYYYPVNGTGWQNIAAALTGTDPTEILDYEPGYQEHGICWGSGENSFYTMESFNQDLHDPFLRSPFWHYDKRAYIDSNNLLLDRVDFNGRNHTKLLSSPLTTLNFSLSSGWFNPSGNNITSKDQFYIAPSANVIATGLIGSTIRCTGDLLLVGSSTNMLNLHPDSGNPGWNIQAYGDNRVYFANVRLSNASTGNTVYAYVSNDFGQNTNWNFGGGAPISGGMGLFISGGNYGMTLVDGLFPLSIRGYTDNTSGNLFLSISGGTPGSIYSTIDLSISGGIRGDITGGLYVSLVNSGVENSIPLYIRGDGISSGFIPTWGVLYLTITNSGVGSGLPISVLGGGSSSGGIPLIIQGKEQTSGGIPLYIGSMGGINSSPNGLRIITHGWHASN